MADNWLGLDLGKLTDPSALAVLEREPLIDSETGRPVRTSQGAPRCRFAVVGLRRYPLGEPYQEIARHVGTLMKRADLPGCRLAVDATGCGIAVLEQIDAAVPDWSRVYPVILTGGAHWTRQDRYWRVPKVELAGAIRSALEAGDIKIAAALEFAKPLQQELLSFETRITRHAHEVFEARPGDYDDLVIACALPIWLAGVLDSQVAFIAGPGEPIRVENPSAAARAVTMGGRITFPSERGGPPGFRAIPFRR
jgi:hypothetical protein